MFTKIVTLTSTNHCRDDKFGVLNLGLNLNLFTADVNFRTELNAT